MIPASPYACLCMQSWPLEFQSSASPPPLIQRPFKCANNFWTFQNLIQLPLNLKTQPALNVLLYRRCCSWKFWINYFDCNVSFQSFVPSSSSSPGRHKSHSQSSLFSVVSLFLHILSVYHHSLQQSQSSATISLLLCASSSTWGWCWGRSREHSIHIMTINKKRTSCRCEYLGIINVPSIQCAVQCNMQNDHDHHHHNVIYLCWHKMSSNRCCYTHTLFCFLSLLFMFFFFLLTATWSYAFFFKNHFYVTSDSLKSKRYFSGNCLCPESEQLSWTKLLPLLLRFKSSSTSTSQHLRVTQSNNTLCSWVPLTPPLQSTPHARTTINCS